MASFSFSFRKSPPPDPMYDPGKLAALGNAVCERLKGQQGIEERGGDQADLFVIPGFLSRQECRRLIKVIDRKVGPSTLFKGTEVEGFRTSATHYFDEEHPVTEPLQRRICDLLGIDPVHAEVMQGQRYERGQQYKHHHDFFSPDQDYWRQERRRGGQRSWTAMVFLNEPEAGGQTDFATLKLAIAPRTGSIVIWNNMDRQGKRNLATLHAGMPVEAGSKYVITQWFRQERFTLWLQDID